jgi:hypothetical protein
VREEEALALIMTLFILAGAALMYSSIVTRRRMREMEHRERLAMIERGLLPSPESDPARFEAGAGVVPPMGATLHDRSTASTAMRYRTAGVLMIGLGLGLMILITFTAGAPSIGIGVGGAWAVLGAASLLNYFLMSGRDTGYSTGLPPRWSTPAPPGPRPQEPPSNVAP